MKEITLKVTGQERFCRVMKAKQESTSKQAEAASVYNDQRAVEDILSSSSLGTST